MARINLDEAIRLTVGAHDACERVCTSLASAVAAGEIDRDEADRIYAVACEEKQAAYQEALEFAPYDFLKNLLTQQRRWQ